MKRACGLLAGALIAAFLLLSVWATPALAAGALSVWVNGVELKAGANYLANGSAVASAVMPAGGYAHFDETTHTLTLNNAIVNTASANPVFPASIDLIGANGDLNIVLSGESTLSYAADSTPYKPIYGIYSNGAITLSGTGELNISIEETSVNEIAAFGIYCDGDLTILSGSYDIFSKAIYAAFGMQSHGAILVADGDIQISAEGGMSFAIYALQDTFRMTGGTVVATVRSTLGFGIGLDAKAYSLEGGSSRYTVTGPENLAAGGLFTGNTLSFTGGVHIFSGTSEGLTHYGTGSVAYTLTGGQVYVSQSTDGSDKRVWTSDADGELAGLYPNVSDFCYVEFTGQPQTGDASRPWLWAGIAGLCLVLGAAGMARMRKKRT